jgi:zinc/manganese transport system substrate-binding protein
MRIIPTIAIAVLPLVAGCANEAAEDSPVAEDRPVVAVTYSVLGSVVTELVGDNAVVNVVIPDGVDPHSFEPSAKDIEAINNAALVVANGLHLEEGLEDVLDTLAADKVFYAADFITTREMKELDDHAHEDEHAHEEDHSHEEEKTDETSTTVAEMSAEDDHSHDEHAHGGIDPHLWLSPFAMSEFVDELTTALESALGVDLADRSAEVLDSLAALDTEISNQIGQLETCELVTGHDELGYFADRYGCELIGAIVPSASTSAEASAQQLAELKKLVDEHQVKAVFTSLGTPQKVAEQVANETGVPLVELSTHVMGESDTYADFMRLLADNVVNALS